MKMGDIQVDGVYLARVGYQRQAKVRAVATRIAYEQRRRRRLDGVRVQLEEPVTSIFKSECHDAGEEIVIASRDVLREWSQEDQDRLELASALAARRERVGELLGRAGYAQDGVGEAGDFDWRGEWLMVRGELLEYVLGLLRLEAGVTSDG